MEYFKPGETAPRSGKYGEVNENGVRTKKTTVTVEKGEQLPPTSLPRFKWVFVA